MCSSVLGFPNQTVGKVEEQGMLGIEQSLDVQCSEDSVQESHPLYGEFILFLV
jgi:hypothetical protein